MHTYIFGMHINTEQINMSNTASVCYTTLQSRQQDNSLLSNIYLSIILLYLLVI